MISRIVKPTTCVSSDSADAGGQPIEAEERRGLKRPPAEAEPGETAGDRQHQRFGQRLPREPSERRAHRVARRQLTDARGRAHEHEVRHIDATDQQHENRAAPQHRQRRLAFADQVRLEVDHVAAEARVLEDLLPLRKALEVRGVDRIQLALRLLERGARLQPSNLLPVVAVPGFVGLVARGERGGAEELQIGIEEDELPGQHADDLVGLAAQPDVLPDGVVAAAKQPLPGSVRKDDDFLLAQLALRLREELATIRLRAKHPEERRRDEHRLDCVRPPPARCR